MIDTTGRLTEDLGALLGMATRTFERKPAESEGRAELVAAEGDRGEVGPEGERDDGRLSRHARQPAGCAATIR